MASTFALSILTPEGPVFDGPVEYVQVPGSQGYLGVLAHHAALVTALAAGDLTVRHAGGREERMRVSGELDDLPQQAFYMCGAIEEAIANAEKMAAMA